jgi:hypothetical protein
MQSWLLMHVISPLLATATAANEQQQDVLTRLSIMLGSF